MSRVFTYEIKRDDMVNPYDEFLSIVSDWFLNTANLGLDVLYMLIVKGAKRP